jgi:Arc/MetJ-type ribon-helix-helix transcriptional regulator
MQPRAIRFSEKAMKEVEAAAQQRGFASSSAFIRYAVPDELQNDLPSPDAIRKLLDD